MNRTLLSLYALAVITNFSLYGRETLLRNETETDMVSSFRNHPHAIQFGPEVFCFDLNSHFHDVKVHGSKPFLGVKVGYEYLKPDAFYFGTDFLLAVGKDGFHDSFEGIDLSQIRGRSAFSTFDLRFGYALSQPSRLITPFFCMGANAFGIGPRQGPFYGFRRNISYFGVGVRSRYEMSENFNLGFNAKVFVALEREEEWKRMGFRRVNHNGLWGGEVSLPLIWRVGVKKNGIYKWSPISSSLILRKRRTVME